MKKKVEAKKTFSLSRFDFWVILLSLVVYFEPQMFKEDYYFWLGYVDNIYKILKILAVVYVAKVYLFKFKFKFSKILIAMGIFQVVGFISTVINSGSIVRFSGPALTTIFMIMASELLIHSGELFNVIKKLLYYFRACFVLNVLSIIFVDFVIGSDGIKLYFLGIDNRWIFTYLPWIAFEFLYSLKYSDKISKKAILFFVVSEITFLYRMCLAAMLINLLWIFVIIKPISSISKHSFKFFSGIVVLNISVVILRVQKLFAKLLQFMKKDITLSGRTLLWDSVLETVKNNPFLGNGMQALEYDKTLFMGNTNLPYLAVSHAHNSFMNVLYRSGIIGLAMYLYIIFISLKKNILNNKNKFSKTLTFAVVITLCLAIFDTLDYAGFYFILACCYNIEYIS